MLLELTPVFKERVASAESGTVFQPIIGFIAKSIYVFGETAEAAEAARAKRTTKHDLMVEDSFDGMGHCSETAFLLFIKIPQ